MLRRSGGTLRCAAQHDENLAATQPFEAEGVSDARSGTEPNGEDIMRAGEYALGLLSPEEAAAFERDMRESAPLRAAYVRWAEEIADLADDIAPVAPPQRVKEEIKAELFGAKPKRSLRGWLIGQRGAFHRFRPDQQRI